MIIFRPRIIKTWEKVAINEMNRQDTVMPCLHCGCKESQSVSRWIITDHFGLFDNNTQRLKKIYGMNLPEILPERLIAYYRNSILKCISGNSYVDYKRCVHCGLVFQNYPHSKESVSFYYKMLYRLPWQSAYKEDNIIIYGRDDQKWIAQQELIGEYFLTRTQLPNGAKVLDVGCAEGIVCKYLIERGINAYGIEPSQAMANYAKVVLNLKNVVCDDYHISNFPRSFFDGIITHHVIEHVFDIDRFFEALSVHLKSGGYLLLQAPCMDNLKTEADYQEILQGGHIYCFSEDFLRSILKNKGFEILEVKKTSCNLSELDRADLSPWGTSAWADDPCGISILAGKK